jgi:hypothetical protein
MWSLPVYALRDASYTFTYNTRTAEIALFDRTAKSRPEGEDADFAPRAPIALREMYRQHLLAWVAAQKKPAVSANATIRLTRSQCEAMKALGYLDSKTDCSKLPDL